MRMKIAILVSGVVFASISAFARQIDQDRSRLADPRFPISMSLAETAHGDAVVSVAELSAGVTTAKQARKLYARALKADHKGQYESALQDMQTAIAVSPAFFQAHAALAAGYIRAGNLDGAERHTEIAASLDPYYLPAREILGLVFFFRGRYRDAADTLGEVVKSAPCRQTAHYFLGRALLKLGETAQAMNHLRTADALLRDRPGVMVKNPGTWDDSTFFGGHPGLSAGRHGGIGPSFGPRFPTHD